MDLNEPQLFPLLVITPLCAGAKVLQALWSLLQSPSIFLLLYPCRHVLWFPGKTGALRLQPKSLLLLPFSILLQNRRCLYRQAWPGQTHRHGAGAVAGAAPGRLLAVISLAGAPCEERRTPRPPGSKGRSPRHTRVTGCREDFSPLLHLLHVFPLYRSLYPFELQKYSRVPLEFTVLRISLSVLRFMA